MTNPGSIVRIRSRSGGHASVYEANMWAQKWQTGLFSGNGVVQNTSPDMNVLVGGTPSKPDIVIGQNPSGYKIALDIVGQQAIPITAPATNSRIASIVAYTNDLSLPSADVSTTGSPSSCGLIVVNGTTSASPEPPTDGQIRAAITADGATGSQAAYGIVANIPIANSTTAVTNTIISIQRSRLALSQLDFAEYPAFAAMTDTTVNVPSGTFTKPSYNIALFDQTGAYDTNNSRFTAQIPGMYTFSMNVARTPYTNGYRHIASFYHKGTEKRRVFDNVIPGSSSGGGNVSFGGTTQIRLAVGDTVEPFMWHGVGNTQAYGVSSEHLMWFSGVFLHG